MGKPSLYLAVKVSFRVLHEEIYKLMYLSMIVLTWSLLGRPSDRVWKKMENYAEIFRNTSGRK